MTKQLLLDVHKELIVDLFAGGGGMSTAFELALGRSPDIAINHNEEALSMHRANHPQTRHFIADVYEVCPRGATQGRPVGWLHLSPDCTHHSQAAGGQPRSKKIRGLSWVGYRWAGQVAPRVISLENVPQILKWGPLIAKRDKATGRVIKLDKSVASELQNRLIGQTGLDTDLKRAADELGMGRLHTIATLTNLDPGNFMVYGPALSRTVKRVTIGPVQTTHGVRLGEIQAPTAPTESLMDEIFGNIEEKAEEAAAADGGGDAKAADAAKRDEARAQIAEYRLRVLGPIITTTEGTQERGSAVTLAVEQTGLNRQTIYNWLASYDPADPLGSLAPTRVPRNWTPTELQQPKAAPESSRHRTSISKSKVQKPKASERQKPARSPRKKVIRLKAGGRQ